jgi:hypothetical protein
MLTSFDCLQNVCGGVAYLDGATGSMVLQAALAGVLTGVYFVKTQWALIKAKFARRQTEPARK